MTGCYTSVSYKYNNILLKQATQVNILNKLTVQPGKTRVFIQNGLISNGFNHYHPNCNIEVRKKDDENTQSVLPGIYQVTAVNEFDEEVVKNIIPLKAVKVATIKSVLFASIDNDGLSDIYRSIHFYLSGEDQNLMRLTCRGALGLPHEAELPTKEEINESLGDLITIEF